MTTNKVFMLGVTRAMDNSDVCVGLFNSEGKAEEIKQYLVKCKRNNTLPTKTALADLTNKDMSEYMYLALLSCDSFWISDFWITEEKIYE